MDASIEYYPRNGLISLGVFYKSIDDEIFTLTTLENLDLGVGRGTSKYRSASRRMRNRPL